MIIAIMSVIDLSVTNLAKNALQEYKTDANEAVKFKLGEELKCIAKVWSFAARRLDDW